MARRPALYLFVLFWALGLPSAMAAGGLVVLSEPGGDYPAGLELRYFADHGHRCNVACARQRFAAGQAERSHVAAPNLGLTGSYWFETRVRNDTEQTGWVVEASAPYLDEVLLYVIAADGSSTMQRSGDMLPTDQRPFRSRNIAFLLDLPPGETATLLVRVTNEGPVTVPLHIQDKNSFEADATEENLVYGLYFGILAGVGLYNLMIFFFMRDRNNLLYVAYVSAFALTMATVFGFSAMYFWPGNPWWINRAVPTLVLVSGFFVLLFSRSFLALPARSLYDRIMVGALAAMVLLLPLAWFAPFGIAVRVIYLVSVLCVLWLLYVGIMQVLSGKTSARYFMLAWVILLIAVAAFLLTKLGVLPSIALTEYGILVGSALEAILLSTALAHRFVLMRNESSQAQTQATLELERRVEERTRELDRALHARSEFLATVSHEIRTPMNGVLGIAELLLDTELNSRQREYTQIIQSSGRTLLTIINDVLDYSKIEAGKMTLEHVPFRIRDVLNSAVQIFRAEAERRKLRFVTAIDDDVPAEIMGDPVRIQQVLNNLLSNAIKFTDDGEIRLTVHREEDGKLTFAVIDTGIGIATDIQPRLFESFNQGDQSMSRRFGGTGLGLAISRRLIEMMGGSISFESDLGRGTTFYFTIPVQQVSSGTWPQISLDGKVPTGSLRLLVVDDNTVNLQVAAGLLRKLGHVVETAGNGRDAIERVFAPSVRYDIVFMDCEMPGMDGYTATRAIRQREQREQRPHTPVVALTAHAFAEKIEACREAGMDDHLAKPLNLRLLEQTLARMTGSR